MEYRKESLDRAFELMKGPDDHIDVVQLERTLSIWRKSKNFSKSKITFIFHMLDKDHDEQLSKLSQVS